MAGPRRVLSSDAQHDLDRFWRYIAEQSGILRAERVLDRIERAMDSLAFMPGLGRPRPYLNPGLLAFPVAPWVIVYQPVPEKDGIVIVRVVDGRRDLAALFER